MAVTGRSGGESPLERLTNSVYNGITSLLDVVFGGFSVLLVGTIWRMCLFCQTY